MRLPLALIHDIANDLAQYRDDEELFLTTIDGETDMLDLVDALLSEADRSADMVDAIKAREEIMRARRQRLEGRALAAKRSITALMEAAGVKKLERPLATISLRAGSVSVHVTHEADLPTQLLTIKTVTSPDKAAIKAQLQAGVIVPGAELRVGDTTIAIRSH